MPKKFPPSPPAPAAPSAARSLDAVIATVQRSQEQALAEQREHGRLLREIVADTTKALLAEPAVPLDFGARAAAGLAAIKRVTAKHQQRAAELTTSVNREIEKTRSRAAAGAKRKAAKSRRAP